MRLRSGQGRAKRGWRGQAMVAVVCAVALGAPAAAAERRLHDDQAAALDAMRKGQIRPLPEILAIVRQATPGEVIDVDLDLRGQDLVYEVRVLTLQGSVVEVDLSARTGAILRREVEDDAGARRRR